MKTALVHQIDVILESNNNAAKGSCFEKLIRNILRIQRYNIQQNVNYAGLEIDLEANHMDRSEKLYVECKAKERVSADEISKFCFNVDFKEADLGYFIRTKELEHQAAGLLNELKAKDKYKKLTFFSPEKVIDILTSHSVYKFPETEFTKEETSKLILAVTYLGDFFIYILNKTSRGLPSHFCVYNAIDGTPVISQNIINILAEKIGDIDGLEIIRNSLTNESLVDVKNSSSEIDSISQVLESENWFDYLPASIEHFIGRDSLKKEVFAFFQKVSQNQTKKRVFYLNSKSGWGKSSMIVYLKGKCMSDYYKNKYYLFGIDSRSILSSNFPALSFQAAVDSALKHNFLSKNKGFENLQFTSGTDVISSESVKYLLDYLQKKGKVLIIVFDQFEDIFRKQGYFKSFYKFLIDINNSQSNLIIGFSWKTEILIPSENESYYLWQLAKDQAESFAIPEFGPQEVNGVIKQLEGSVGNIRIDLKRNLIEGSQGFPWLIKKFCIHVYNQIQAGVRVDDLIEVGVKFQDLFVKDLENLNGEEIKSLNYIAKRAYDGRFFDETEVGDIIKESIISSLRDKRLIIKSGVNYNIYWDIFRDYLVNGTVPVIGETYILRASYSACLTTFLQFKDGKDRSTEDIRKAFPRKIQENSLNNILIELRSIGLLAKRDNGDYYLVDPELIVSEECFKFYIKNKFLTYTPYIELNKIKASKFSSFEVVNIMKKLFKGYYYQDKTWKAYTATLINWFRNAEMDIVNNYANVRDSFSRSLNGENSIHYLPHFSPNSIITTYNAVIKGEKVDAKSLRELRNLDLITKGEGEDDYAINPDLIQAINSGTSVSRYISSRVMNIEKIGITVSYLTKYPNSSLAEFVREIPELFLNRTTKNSKDVAASAMMVWARFCMNAETNISVKALRSDNSLLVPLSRVSPKSLLDAINNLSKMYFNTSQDKLKLRALIRLELVIEVDGIFMLSPIGKEIIKMPSREGQLHAISMTALKDKDFEELFKAVNKDEKPIEIHLKQLFPETYSNYSILSAKNRAYNIKSWVKHLKQLPV